MKFHLRAARLADVDAMRALFRETVLTVNARDYSREQTEAWAGIVDDPVRTERLRARIGRQYFLVAEQDGDLVGFCSLEPDGYLDLFYVHKDHQGKGIGSALMEGLLAEGRRMGLPSITSEVSITARPFFERRGFQAEKEQWFDVKGVVLNNTAMRRVL